MVECFEKIVKKYYLKDTSTTLRPAKNFQNFKKATNGYDCFYRQDYKSQKLFTKKTWCIWLSLLLGLLIRYICEKVSLEKKFLENFIAEYFTIYSFLPRSYSLNTT